MLSDPNTTDPTVESIRPLLESGEARALRERAGMSQADVAEVVGVHHSMVCGWERGYRLPRAAAAKRYADLLAEWTER